MFNSAVVAYLMPGNVVASPLTTSEVSATDVDDESIVVSHVTRHPITGATTVEFTVPECGSTYVRTYAAPCSLWTRV